MNCPMNWFRIFQGCVNHVYITLTKWIASAWPLFFHKWPIDHANGFNDANLMLNDFYDTGIWFTQTKLRSIYLYKMLSVNYWFSSFFFWILMLWIAQFNLIMSKNNLVIMSNLTLKWNSTWNFSFKNRDTRKFHTQMNSLL